jgi:hypothetical protein
MERIYTSHHRRNLLKALAVTAAGAGSVANISSVLAQARESRPDRFGRMFPRLAPFATLSEPVTQALLEMGRPGGMMDAKDALERGPVDLIVDPALSLNNPNNVTHTAGTTFIGQFLDHDMTFDTTSRLGIPAEPRRSRNSRVPTLELDSVYGEGPFGSLQLYDQQDRVKLRIESGGLFEDVPRNAEKTAIIADPRNDENLIISGLQAAFIKFHNRAVDYVRQQNSAQRRQPQDVFDEARQLTTWHYQWMIVNEFLPLFIGQALTTEILTRGGRFYRPDEGEGFIPVEFQAAAYRFGHSMIRPSYRANLAGDNGKPFFGLVFAPGQVGVADPIDLSGAARAPRRFIGWQTFFNFGDGEVKPNKRIDTTLSTPLFDLPLPTIAGFTLGSTTSLPQRNLLRHLTWQLPSGQSIAREMRVPVLSADDLQDVKGLGAGFETSTPLFFYILREAHVMAQGLTLGPVGGRIVGEVILGLLQSDAQSYLSARRNWRPTLPTRSGQVTGDFRMIDFLTFAGVDPTSRGQ